MESRLPLRSLQGINNAAPEQSPIVGILRTQLGLIRKSDPLTESQRDARSRLLKDRTTVSGRAEVLSLIIFKLEILQTQAARFDQLHSNPSKNLQSETSATAKEAKRNLLSAAGDVFGSLEKAAAFEGGDFGSQIEKSLREVLMRGFFNISGSGAEDKRLNFTNLAEWMAILPEEVADRSAIHGIAVAINSFVSSLVGDAGKLTLRISALEREKVGIEYQLNEINSQAEVNREKLFSGFQQIAKSLTHVNSQKRFCTNRFDNRATESFYSSL